MTSRSFHLGDILSVTTERLVSNRHIDGVYDVLNHMTGDNLLSDQLPRANDECRPFLLLQHPDLLDVQVPDEFDPEKGEEHVEQWLAEQVARFGEYRDVEPLNDGDHTRIDPIAELRMMRPDLPIIAVES